MKSTLMIGLVYAISVVMIGCGKSDNRNYVQGFGSCTLASGDKCYEFHFDTSFNSYENNQRANEFTATAKAASQAQCARDSGVFATSFCKRESLVGECLHKMEIDDSIQSRNFTSYRSPTYTKASAKAECESTNGEFLTD